jgi:hypothetical protein
VPLRRVAALLLVCATVLSGCRYSAALSKREVVVVFQPHATQAQHRLVLASCGNITDVAPEAMGNGQLPSELMSNVRFRIDHASDANLGRLYDCLLQFSFVLTSDIPDTSH